MLDDVELDITCPECGHKNVTTLRKLKSRPDFACSRCNELMDIDIGELTGIVKKAIEDAKKQQAGRMRFTTQKPS